ncbi:MAG TPA: hypothetical protein VMT16_04975 [Thermoanaerobaculia bacterium]|nr:hypothetical protein [Thermoanaerobaculia bacterium]
MKRTLPGALAQALIAVPLLAVPLLATSPPTGPTVVPQAELAALLDSVAPAILRVEAVVKVKLNMAGQGEEQDSRFELMGAVVDPRGLLMMWNSHISSARVSELMREMGPGGGFDVDMRPTAFTVSLGDGRGDVPAFLAATESNLDLAFLQLEHPPAAPLPFVDFAASATPAVGELVAAVHRLGRGFDYAPYLQTARIGGVLAKPRRAYIPDGSLAALGLPVFDLAGRPVGALTTVLSRVGDEPGAALGVRRLMGALTQGQGAAGPLGTFILPGERVADLVALARAQADELLAQRQAAERP